MSTFRNVANGNVVSVDDSKDGRFPSGLWESVGKATKQAATSGTAVPAKKAAKRSAKKAAKK